MKFLLKPFHTATRHKVVLRRLFMVALLAALLILAGCKDSSQLITTLAPSPPQPGRTMTPALPSRNPSPERPTATPAATATELVETNAAGINFQDLPLSGIGYRIPLTVRHVTGESVVLFFELDQPAAGELLVRQSTGGEHPVQAIPLPDETARHQITVGNLVPGTATEAIVVIHDFAGKYEQPVFLDAAWGSVHFHTQSNARPSRVGVVGDSGFGEEVTFKLLERMAESELDFVIHTGDVIYRSSDNADPVEAFALKFYRPFAPVLHQMPVYLVPGNHEYERAAHWQDSPFYYYAFPPFTDPSIVGGSSSESGQYYAVAYQDIQFLLLDSEVFWGVEGREAQDAWLTERLMDDRFRYSIPIFHIPPFTSSAVHPDDSIPLRRWWHPLFASARVPLVLSGHNHHYERLLANEITYIVSGGGSNALYGAGTIAPESKFFAPRSHFVLLEIYDDRIEISAIDQDGIVFDRAAVPLDYPPAPPAN